MSYRLCVHVVPYEEIDQAGLLRALHAAAQDLDDPSRRPPLYAIVTDPARAAADLAWQVVIAAADGEAEGPLLTPGYFSQFLSPLPHSLVLHDDSRGRHGFRHRHPDAWFELDSDGPFLTGDVERIAGDYPQRGFTAEELRAILAKPEAAMTPRERAAVMAYADAIALGLRQFYPRPLRILDLCYAEKAFVLSDPRRKIRKPREVPLPRPWRGYVAWATEEPASPTPALAPADRARRWAKLADWHEDPARALRAYERALALEPDDPTVLFNLACTFSLARRRDEMLDALARAIAADPDQRADAREDDDFKRYRKDPEFVRLTREVSPLRARIERIDWSASDAAAHRRSRVALLREFLRRSALWSEALGCPTLWPFFDLAARVDPPSPEVEPPRLRPGVALPELVRATLGWMLRWEAIGAAAPGVDLPDPYEPLLVCYERGGAFRREQRLLDVGLAALALGERDEHLHRAALRSLDPAELDRLDGEES